VTSHHHHKENLFGNGGDEEDDDGFFLFFFFSLFLLLCFMFAPVFLPHKPSRPNFQPSFHLTTITHIVTPTSSQQSPPPPRYSHTFIESPIAYYSGRDAAAHSSRQHPTPDHQQQPHSLYTPLLVVVFFS